MKLESGTKVYTFYRTDGIYSPLMECVVVGFSGSCIKLSWPFADPFFVPRDEVFLTKSEAYKKQAMLVREDLARKNLFLEQLEQLIDEAKNE